MESSGINFWITWGFICRSRLRNCKGLEFSKRNETFSQGKYINYKLVEYDEYINGALEPISIVFSAPDQLGTISFWIDGEVVASIDFEDNHVSEFHINQSEVKKMWP